MMTDGFSGARTASRTVEDASPGAIPARASRRCAAATATVLMLVVFAAGCRTALPPLPPGAAPAQLIRVTTPEQFDAQVFMAGRKRAAFFYSPDCPWCKVIMRSLKKDVPGFGAGNDVVLVNIREVPAIRARYEVKGVPAVLYLDGGKEKKRDVGWSPRKSIPHRIAGFYGLL